MSNTETGPSTQGQTQGERKLDGKVAIVTGSSSGNGRAIAIAFARQGASVVCSDIRREAREGGYEGDIQQPTDEVIAGSASASSIETATPPRPIRSRRSSRPPRHRSGAWTSSSTTRACSPACTRSSTRPRTMGLHDGGQRQGRLPRLQSGDHADARPARRGPALARQGHQHRLDRGPRRLAAEPAYCASKGAVVNLTRQLAVDFAPERINVNAICPGFLATAMVRPFLDDPELSKTLHDNSPWPTLGTAEDVADAAVFLASEDSRWVTGSNLTVDGGYTAG